MRVFLICAAIPVVTLLAIIVLEYLIGDMLRGCALADEWLATDGIEARRAIVSRAVLLSREGYDAFHRRITAITAAKKGDLP